MVLGYQRWCGLIGQLGTLYSLWHDEGTVSKGRTGHRLEQHNALRLDGRGCPDWYLSIHYLAHSLTERVTLSSHYALTCSLCHTLFLSFHCSVLYSLSLSVCSWSCALSVTARPAFLFHYSIPAWYPMGNTSQFHLCQFPFILITNTSFVIIVCKQTH